MVDGENRIDDRPDELTQLCDLLDQLVKIHSESANRIDQVAGEIERIRTERAEKRVEMRMAAGQI